MESPNGDGSSLPPARANERQLFAVRTPDGAESKFKFDGRPLSEQLQDMCKLFNLEFDDQENYYVLTQGTNPGAPVVRSEAQVLALPRGWSLGLRKAADLVQERLAALRAATKGEVAGRLRGLLSAIFAEEWIAVEVILKDGIHHVLKAIFRDNAESVTELAMACMCELCVYPEAVTYMEENPQEISSALFQKIFLELFPAPNTGRVPGKTIGFSDMADKKMSQRQAPRATLQACLFLLHKFPETAKAAHEAALGVSWGDGQDASDAHMWEPIYPRMVKLDADDFQSNAALSVLSAMVHVASPELQRSIHAEVASSDPDEDVKDILQGRDQLAEQMHIASMSACAELVAQRIHEGLLPPEQMGRASEQETRALEKRVESLEQVEMRLKDELKRRHEQMKLMVGFMKVESSALVEQSLEGIVKTGWDSIHWKRNYNLLHYVSECVEDPTVVELVGLFATDVNQRDDNSMRPIDFARQSGRSNVVRVLERLRKYQRKGPGARTRMKSGTDTMHNTSSGHNASNRAELKQRLKEMKSLQPNIRQALEAVLDVGWENVQWPSNFTAMHLAAKLGSVDAVEWLVRANADLTVPDQWGLTPLDYAVQGGKQDVIVALQEHIASGSSHTPSSASTRKETSHEASGKHKSEQSASHSATGRRGPPRELTAEERKQLVVPENLRPELQKACEAVLKKGWDRIKWPKNFSALHLAARMGSADAINLLIDASAWPGLSLEDDKGLRPLDYARDKKHFHLLELLDTGGAAPKTASSPSDAANQSKGSVLPIPAAAGQAVADPIDMNQVPGTPGGNTPVPMSPTPGQTDETLDQDLTSARTREVVDLGLVELRSELVKLREERAGWQKERQKLLDGSAGVGALAPGHGMISTAGLGMLFSGGLNEDTLKQHLTELQTFGREKVLTRLTEAPPPLSERKAMDEMDAARVLDQLELILRLTAGTTTQATEAPQKGKGPPKGKGKGPPPPGAKAAEAPPAEAEAKAEPEAPKAGKGKKGKGPPPPGGKGPPPPPAEGGKGPPPPGGKGPPPPGGKGPGKGPPPGPGKKGAPAPKDGKGGGKAKAKGGGKNDDAGLAKPKIQPGKPMKPVWWTRFILGQQIKKGETIWDEVNEKDYPEAEEALPITLLEERFSKNAVAPKAKAPKAGEEKKEEVKLLRIITDTNIVVGREAALKQLPPANDVARALVELDDQALTVDFLHVVAEHACPTPPQMNQLREERKKSPNIPLALPEQYMWVIGNLPAYQQRLDCWQFVRTYSERQESYLHAIIEFERIVKCFKESECMPSLLGLVLATGNYLNGGTNRGQADGFDLEALDKLESVKDATGKDIRHFILDVFFNQFPDKAATLIDELNPALQNITRRLNKDSDGTEKFSKSARIAIEDFDKVVNALRDEFISRHDTMKMILEYFEDPADPFRLRMPNEFAQAKEVIDDLVQQKDNAKALYGKVLDFFKVTGMKSEKFSMLWDDLLIPADLITQKGEKMKKEFLVPTFCRQKPLYLDDLMVLWDFKDLESRQKADAKPRRGKARAGRRGTVRAGAKNAPQSTAGEAGDDGEDASGAAAEKTPGGPPKGKGKPGKGVTPTSPQEEASASPSPGGKAKGKGKLAPPSPAAGMDSANPSPTASPVDSPREGPPASPSGKAGPPKGKGKGKPPPPPVAAGES